MRNYVGMLPIMRRELSAYFHSPIAYIFLCVFVALTGFLFMSNFFLIGLADMRGYFNTLPMLLCVFLPAVSMRQWSEEKHSGTYELLLTLPLTSRALVLGKFFAALIFYMLGLLATSTIPIMLMIIGAPDLGPIIGGYVGVICLGAMFLALGLFISGLCRDQIVAFIVSMMCCFLLYVVGTEFIAATIDGWVSGLGSVIRGHVSVTPHYEAFQKGVLDGRDLLYFLVSTGVLLMLNGLWIEGRLRPNQSRMFTMACAIACGILISSSMVVGSLPIGRIDLTVNKRFTVSPVTRQIFAALDAPATITYYVSPTDKMPTSFKTLERNVVDILDELQHAASSHMEFRVVHMEATQATTAAAEEDTLERQLMRRGIRPFQVQSIEADELGVRLVYSGLSIKYSAKPEETIARVLPDNIQQLEHLITSKVHRLTLKQQPRIALVAPFAETPVDPQIRALMQQLGQDPGEQQVQDAYRLIPLALRNAGYEVRRVTMMADNLLPDDATTVIVLEPGDLGEEQHQALAQFLVEGGHVFIAAQSRTFTYGPSGHGEIAVIANRLTPNINTLLGAWGVGLDADVLLDAVQEPLTVSSGAQVGPFAVSVPLKLPVHIRIPTNGMNQESSLTSRLAPIVYLWGSALAVAQETLEAQGLHMTTLLSSSPDSWMIPEAQLKSMRPTSQPAPGDRRGPFPLAVSVEGRFTDPYASKRTTPLTSAPGQLIVMGAHTLFQEQLLERGGHLTLLLNIVDALSLTADLTQIRAKQPVDRSIGRIPPGAKAWWRFFVSILIPLLTAIAGWTYLLFRQRATHQYIAAQRA